MLNSVPGPYTCFSDFDKFFRIEQSGGRHARKPKLRFRSTSWRIRIVSFSTEGEAYRFVGRVLA